jgi:hypothetical protein
MKDATQVGFHDIHEAFQVAQMTPTKDTKFTYTFENFFHPYVGELIGKLNTSSLAGFLDPNYHQSLSQVFFTNYYPLLRLKDGSQSPDIQVNSFPKEIDVHNDGPYANYNWELLFHIPLTVAVHLSKNQRFAEAQRWFHYIFDPTSNDTSVPMPQRFWKFLRFRQNTDVQQIGDLLALLSKPDIDCTQAELDLKKMVRKGYEAIKHKPFQPHAVARTRTLSYQYSVVMKYLDNLIAWGDSLFLQDTIESINEATQRYVLAANILGPRPQQIPPSGTTPPKTFAQLKAATQDPLGNALVELEGQFPFNLALPQTRAGSGPSGPLFGIGRTLYFCIPRNDRLLTYWDTVADRLFKIRHCMNIEGVVRQLALFEPPIDPGMLVKAAAAGIDVGSIVGGLNQPIGPLRCLPLIQKALELAGEVRGLGNALLSALEKGDGERLALLRQGHEIQIQQMTQEIRFLQWKQAQEATEALLFTRKSALERYHYYQRMMGLTPDSTVAPDTFPLDRRELTEENFDEAYSTLVSTYDKTITIPPYPQLKLAGRASPANQSGASGNGNLYLAANEDVELNTHLPTARDTRLAASIADTVASVLTFIPDFDIHLHWWGLGASSRIFGGLKLSDASKIAAEILRVVSAWEQDQAGMASKTASYERRADDWMLQNSLAARDLMQIGRQIISSLIAEQVAHHEYLTVQKQVSQSQEVQRFLQGKFTSEELYGWMQGEISRLYYEYYRFAFDTARRAERTMKQELMRPELDNTDFVQFNYWDGGRKGLLCGEALYLDIKRMEMAYHDNNKREFEITRHVSLRQLDPLALLKLKTTGTCEVSIPEWLYDQDCPGHYMRRLKNVAISIPSVVGPYTSINCTLSLLGSSLRKSPQLKDGKYARKGQDDDRFVDYLGSVESIVTSGGSNDSGMFETNLRDERFLPFEGAGAVSTWRLQLPGQFRPFDYMTISDAILHVRYTARQGGDSLGNQALQEMREMFKTANQVGLALLFSLRNDFPSQWSAFVNGTGDFTATIRRDHFPYFTQGAAITITGLELYGQDVTKHHAVGDPAAATTALAGQGQFTLTVKPDASGPTQVLTRTASAQVFLIIGYSLG